jgi:hypothetical protein
MNLEIVRGLLGGEQAVLNAILRQIIDDEIHAYLNERITNFEAGWIGVHKGFRGGPSLFCEECPAAVRFVPLFGYVKGGKQHSYTMLHTLFYSEIRRR